MKVAGQAENAGRYAGFSARRSVWFGMLAPTGTPAPIIARLNAEFAKVLGTPDMKEKLYKAGFQIRAKGAKDAWARVTKEIDMFKGIIEQAGIKKL